jgi:adenosylcobinamide-GDP ribazoletransferase
MKKLLLAFQFLTIIPVKDTGELTDKETGGASALFPVVGLAEGVLLAVLALLLLKVFQVEVVNALLVLVLIILNGCLHLDGLADTFDAIAARGDSDRKLAVMKDSSIGPAGVISIVMALLLNYVLLNAVHFLASGDVYLGIVLLMPVASRWAMVPALYYGKPARREGLGKSFIESTGLKEFVLSTLLMFIIVLTYALVFSDIDLFLSFSMVNFPVLFALSLVAVWFSNIHFEGLTGDQFGAVNEIARLIFLITSLLWLQQSI